VETSNWKANVLQKLVKVKIQIINNDLTSSCDKTVLNLKSVVNYQKIKLYKICGI